MRLIRNLISKIESGKIAKLSNMEDCKILMPDGTFKLDTVQFFTKVMAGNLFYAEADLLVFLFGLPEEFKDDCKQSIRNNYSISNNYFGLFMTNLDNMPDSELLMKASGEVQLKVLKHYLSMLQKDINNSENFMEADIRFTYKNLLIFISGNISSDDMDYTEDSLVSELSGKFLPEQLSRLTSNMIVYDRFTEEDYDKMTNKLLDEYKSLIYKLHGIKLVFDRSKMSLDTKYPLKDYVKNNYKGMRQVYTAINNYISETLPVYLKNRMGYNNSDMSEDEKKICAELSEEPQNTVSEQLKIQSSSIKPRRAVIKF